MKPYLWGRYCPILAAFLLEKGVRPKSLLSEPAGDKAWGGKEQLRLNRIKTGSSVKLTSVELNNFRGSIHAKHGDISNHKALDEEIYQP